MAFASAMWSTLTVGDTDQSSTSQKKKEDGEVGTYNNVPNMSSSKEMLDSETEDTAHSEDENQVVMSKHKAVRSRCQPQKNKKKRKKTNMKRNIVQNIHKSEAMKSRSSSTSSNAETKKRQIQNKNERKRRRAQKQAADDLRLCIPELRRNEKASQKVIVQTAKTYICQLAAERKEVDEEIARELHMRHNLQAQLQELGIKFP